MKKSILLLLCLAVLCLGIWYLLARPTEEAIDTTLPGYRFSQSGKGQPSTLKIQGTYVRYRFSPEKDQFYPGYDGGIWLDGKILPPIYVTFPDTERDWIQGTGHDSQGGTVDFVAYRELKPMVLLTTLEGETVLAVFPTASREEAISILENLPETQTKIETFPTA